MRITKGPLPKTAPRRAAVLSRDQALSLALCALSYVVEEDRRIEKFLQLTGVDPSDLPALAPEPSFLLAVLDHLAGDEELLLSFAGEQRVRPETIELARRALGGGEAG
jgi:hypothetical protein